MIELVDKKDCCGCNACVSKCPKQCIKMEEDYEGFLYPVIDKGVCIDCGLCEKVCPVINQNNPGKPLKVYAAKNQDEKIRMESSSGGIFTLLAEYVLSEGGVVFGAKFNKDWEVIHDYTETSEGLAVFRGSKYVQSQIGETYRQAEEFLKQGRKVLFSGTPCQIAGLKLFLRREYVNLLAVDFVCHGVPSPKVFRMYLNETIARQGVDGEKTVLSYPIDKRSLINDIKFRDKRLGWKKYSFALTLSVPLEKEEKSILFSEPLTENVFMKGFLKDLYLRPSCYQCPSKSFKSGSDLSIADYWGIQNVLQDFDDDMGVSLVLVNTEKGETIYKNINVISVETSYQKAFQYNPCLEINVKLPKSRKIFYNSFECISLYELVYKSTYIPLYIRLKFKIIQSIYLLFSMISKRMKL
ncbi:Coenzyme F420 hydrogenase/dehydrogenase, beta subunit C-terminal domain [Bacteroides sedimenti]|uniref:F420H(2):quinone oxidoreductase n=1 Tax=Bacteroides sedimenti TaxID=2136147 RepID=A0ABM8I6W2_9BACE